MFEGSCYIDIDIVRGCLNTHTNCKWIGPLWHFFELELPGSSGSRGDRSPMFLFTQCSPRTNSRTRPYSPIPLSRHYNYVLYASKRVF